MAKTKSIKVLAIDGGGIRGIIPAVILDELQKRLDTELWNAFDMIAGTSTGGIIALGIGTRCKNGLPYTASDLVNMYVENGPSIFKQTLLTSEEDLLFPKYSAEPIETVLAKFFQDTKFDSALTPLLVSSYDLQSQLPFFFKSHRIAADPTYNWNVRDIARATSAAPTYFPTFHLSQGKQNYALVDGGVCVNNPSMAAYAESLMLYPKGNGYTIISVGTGDRQDRITYDASKNWGMVPWAKQIVPVLMDSVSESVDYEMNAQPGCTYYRLQVPDLQPPSSDMDNVTPENLSNLQAIAREFISSNTKLLDKVCAVLKEGRGSNVAGIGRK